MAPILRSNPRSKRLTAGTATVAAFTAGAGSSELKFRYLTRQTARQAKTRLDALEKQVETIPGLKKQLNEFESNNKSTNKIIRELRQEVKTLKESILQSDLMIRQRREQAGKGQFIFPCSISNEVMAEAVNTGALVDTGASLTCITRHFVEKHKIPTHELLEPITFSCANGTTERNTEFCEIEVTLGRHSEKVLTILGKGKGQNYRPLVLGKDWMEKHDVVLRPKAKEMSFSPASCTKTCLPDRKLETIRCIERGSGSKS